MMQISRGRAASAGVARLAMSLLVLMTLAGPLRAARVANVYADSVPVADASPEATRAALAVALRGVLVKATGQDAAASDPAVLSRFGDPSALVQQFRRDGSGSLWVQFDPVAIRRGLQAAGLPVWDDERPVTVVWLAYDTGAGERDVLASGGTDGPTTVALRRDLLAAATGRAVPLLLPLRDSQDLAAVAWADVWGDFTEPVTRASARYRADAVLIGRARLFPPGMTDVRWTLLVAGERLEWRGSVADGPRGLAERLAQRLASGAVSGSGSGAARIEVSGITSIDSYGLVISYLQGLDVVESVYVARAAGDTIGFDLELRGDRERLVRALSVRRLIEPVADPAGADPDLQYRLVAGP